MNDYESAARARKIVAMMAAIDKAAIAKGIDPYGNAGQVWLAINEWKDSDWDRVDRVAQLKHKSSKTTREEVKKNYMNRANAEPLDRQ
jgi:hypothetical protein